MVDLAIITLPFIFLLCFAKNCIGFYIFLKVQQSTKPIKDISIPAWINVQYKPELNNERSYHFICDRVGRNQKIKV